MARSRTLACFCLGVCSLDMTSAGFGCGHSCGFGIARFITDRVLRFMVLRYSVLVANSLLCWSRGSVCHPLLGTRSILGSQWSSALLLAVLYRHTRRRASVFCGLARSQTQTSPACCGGMCRGGGNLRLPFAADGSKEEGPVRTCW